MIRYADAKAIIQDGVQKPIWSAGPDAETIDRELAGIEARMPHASRMVIKAQMIAWILENAAIAVEDEAVFADRIRHSSAMRRVRQRWIEKECAWGSLEAALSRTQAGVSAKAWNGVLDCSHTCPDWERVLRLGIPGIINELARCREKGADPDFYRAGTIAWEGIRVFALRLARRAAGAPCAEGLTALASRAPDSFPEAIQLMLLVYAVQNDLDATDVRSFGRLDRVLLPFYRQDLARGKYTREELKEFLRFFFARISAINHKNNIPICLGGGGGINELTLLIREVYDEMGVYSPKIQVRVTPEVPESFLRDVLFSIRAGRSSDVFVNDASVIPALEKLGIAREDAENYVPVGCYEPDAAGEVPCTCAGTVNLLKCVETALHNGEDPQSKAVIGPRTGDAFPSYEAFEKAVFEQLRAFISSVMDRVNALEDRFARLNPAPVFSSTLADCVRQGKDAYQGGAKYSNTSINLIGMADATDALCAIRWAVFEKQWVSMGELCEILADNWRGQESLRRKIRFQAPRYGNGDQAADRCAERLCRFAVQWINGVPNHRGGVYRAGLFSIDWVFAYGKGVGATPEGRYAGEPLSKNLNATMGSDRKGPTFLMNTAARLARCGIPNGAVLDLMLHPTAVEGDKGIQALAALVRAFEKIGGQCLQMNVFDEKTLRDAQAHPERYDSLQVRVCGWNALFTRLSREEQDVFIGQAGCQAREQER